MPLHSLPVSDHVPSPLALLSPYIYWLLYLFFFVAPVSLFVRFIFWLFIVYSTFHISTLPSPGIVFLMALVVVLLPLVMFMSFFAFPPALSCIISLPCLALALDWCPLALLVPYPCWLLFSLFTLTCHCHVLPFPSDAFPCTLLCSCLVLFAQFPF